MNDVIAELNTAVSTDVGVKFLTYYIGEAVVVPQSNLPALMIIPNSTTVVAKTTTQDQYEYSITVRAVVDVKSYLDEGGTGTTIDTQSAIIDLMEERNADQTVKTSTVLGSLRKAIAGTSYKFNNELKILYKAPEGKEFPYARAEIELTAITDLLTRPT